MTQCLFFCGKGTTEQEALRSALLQCADILLTFPSLVVELIELAPDGHHYDAHIRVMAIAKESVVSSGGAKQKPPGKDYVPKSPEHIKSGNPNEWRPIGMTHENFLMPLNFGEMANAGALPDIPTQDFHQAQKLHFTPDEARDYYVAQHDAKTMRDLLKPSPDET